MIMSAIEKKKCCKCKNEKYVSEFYRNGRNYTSWCKDCLREYSRARVKDGRDRLSKIKHEEKKGHFRNQANEKEHMINKIAVEMYRNAKRRSLYNEKPFNINVSDIRELILQFSENNYCVLEKGKNPFKPSLDRIDNRLGYTLDNIKVVWLIENYCKNTFTDNDVLEFCKRKVGLF